MFSILEWNHDGNELDVHIGLNICFSDDSCKRMLFNVVNTMLMNSFRRDVFVLE